MTTTTRRHFLQQTGTGALAMRWTTALHAAGANEKVVMALIGCGKRGRKFFDQVDFVCDPDRERLQNAAKKATLPSSHAVTDLRHLLDNQSIDAVIIATPDHWHAPAAIMACEAGKHVYVEKPCSHNFRESRLLLDAARHNKVVVQHGTQQRSSPFTMEAMQSLREGVIGEVLVAKAWNVQHRKNIGHQQPSAPPRGVDYDLWLGPAEYMPYQSNRFHYDWHWWHNFGTGGLGGDGPHELDYARWGLGVDTLPSKITAVGGKYFYDDDQQFPDTATCVFEYPGNGKVGNQKQLVFEMRLWSTNYPHNCDSGVEFYGTQGQMFFSKRGKLEVLDSRNQRTKTVKKKLVGEHIIAAHVENFRDAIRSGNRPNADIEEAHRTVALVHLANIAVRTGRELEMDPEQEQLLGDPEASKLLTRTYRQKGHWAIPKASGS